MVLYRITFSCGHKTPARKFLPLLVPRVNTSDICWSCWANRRIEEVEEIEMPDAPKKPRLPR